MTGALDDEAAWRGWRLAAFPRGSWSIEGDALHARTGAERVSLVSRGRFADFELAFEWRLSVGGNSGVLYRVDESVDEPWQSGPEMQLLDDVHHADGRTPATSCGALYGVVAPHSPPDCPPGLYHAARIVVRGSRVEHWLNGACVVAVDLSDADVRERIRRSKFARHPGYATARAGHIVLQHHGSEAWFRAISITPLATNGPGA